MNLENRSGQIWYGIEYGLFALWEWFAQHFELVNIWLYHIFHIVLRRYSIFVLLRTHNATKKKQTLTHNNNQQKRMPFSVFISNRFYAWISISFSDDFLISRLLFVLIFFPLLVGYPKLFHMIPPSVFYTRRSLPILLRIHWCAQLSLSPSLSVSLGRVWDLITLHTLTYKQISYL